MKFDGWSPFIGKRGSYRYRQKRAAISAALFCVEEML